MFMKGYNLWIILTLCVFMTLESRHPIKLQLRSPDLHEYFWIVLGKSDIGLLLVWDWAID